MSQKITSLDIINLIETTENERISINRAVENLNRRRDEYMKSEEALAIESEDRAIADRTMLYTKEIDKLKKLMDREYGYGNWQDLDVKELTFLTRQELESDPEWKKKHYILANPDIKEKAEIEDIKVVESNGE